MNDEYRPTMDELIESYAYSGDGSDFKAAMWARSAAAYELLTAHDAEIRRDQAQKAKYGECVVCHQPFERYDSPGGVFRSHFEHPADDHEAQFTPSPETEQENTQ